MGPPALHTHRRNNLKSCVALTRLRYSDQKIPFSYHRPMVNLAMHCANSVMAGFAAVSPCYRNMARIQTGWKQFLCAIATGQVGT
jgi:hypothetical protein